MTTKHRPKGVRSPLTPHQLIPDPAEINRLRLNYANLLASARATLTAWRDDEPDPLMYLIDELDAVGQLPPIQTMQPSGTAQQRLDAWHDAVRPWGTW